MNKDRLTCFFNLVIFSVLVLVLTQQGFAQKRINKPGSDIYFSKPLQLIDLPTASILQSGDIRASIRLFEQGGALGRLSVGVSKRIMFGVSYGGLEVLGESDKIDWYNNPGVHFCYRLIEETRQHTIPAVVIGFDSQGYGQYLPKSSNDAAQDSSLFYDRYKYKSRGFYLVASKSLSWIWDVGIHAGINMSLENDDDDKDPDIFMGMNVILTRDLSVFSEYDFASNDDEKRGKNNAKGYLNAGVRWAFSGKMFLEFAFKNLLADDDPYHPGGQKSRIIKFVYCDSILR